MRSHQARCFYGSFLHQKVTRRNYFCLEPIFGEVFRIQSDDEIGLALFRAKTEWIIFGVGRNLNGGAHPDLFGPLSDQVDDPSRSGLDEHGGASELPCILPKYLQL